MRFISRRTCVSVSRPRPSEFKSPFISAKHLAAPLTSCLIWKKSRDKRSPEVCALSLSLSLSLLSPFGLYTKSSRASQGRALWQVGIHALIRNVGIEPAASYSLARSVSLTRADSRCICSSVCPRIREALLSLDLRSLCRKDDNMRMAGSSPAFLFSSQKFTLETCRSDHTA